MRGNVLSNFCFTCLKGITCLNLLPLLQPVIWNMNAWVWLWPWRGRNAYLNEWWNNRMERTWFPEWCHEVRLPTSPDHCMRKREITSLGFQSLCVTPALPLGPCDLLHPLPRQDGQGQGMGWGEDEPLSQVWYWRVKILEQRVCPCLDRQPQTASQSAVTLARGRCSAITPGSPEERRSGYENLAQTTWSNTQALN